MIPNIDALAYLQVSTITDLAKGQTINLSATASTPSTSWSTVNIPGAAICIILSGEVKVERESASGPIVIDIYGRDQIVSEGALIGDTSEIATAISPVRVMSWTLEQVQNGKPELIQALLQLALKRSSERATRIMELASLQIEERVMAALLRFASNIGTPIEGGRQIPALSHQLIADYIGTSREIVTKFMIIFRNRGMVQYDRKSITIYPVSFVNAERKAAA